MLDAWSFFPEISVDRFVVPFDAPPGAAQLRGPCTTVREHFPCCGAPTMLGGCLGRVHTSCGRRRRS